MPIICPMLGAVLGAWLYQLFIGIQIPDDDVDYLGSSQLDLLKTGNSSPILPKSMYVYCGLLILTCFTNVFKACLMC